MKNRPTTVLFTGKRIISLVDWFCFVVLNIHMAVKASAEFTEYVHFFFKKKKRKTYLAATNKITLLQ
jgi:hypothetical protein